MSSVSSSSSRNNTVYDVVLKALQYEDDDAEHGSSIETDDDVYCGRLETLNLDRAKTPGFDDRKRVNISNMDPFTIVESREFSRRSKSKFQADRSITLATTPPKLIPDTHVPENLKPEDFDLYGIVMLEDGQSSPFPPTPDEYGECTPVYRQPRANELSLRNELHTIYSALEEHMVDILPSINGGDSYGVQ